MRNRLACAAWIAAALLDVAALDARQIARQPQPAQPHQVISELIAHQTELGLTDQQAAALSETAASFQRRETLARLSSKPWTIPGGPPTSRQAWDAAARVLTPEQRRTAEHLGLVPGQDRAP